MTSLKTVLTGVSLALSALALSACTEFQFPHREGISASQKAACHAQAEDRYVAQNRADIYRADANATGNTSPFSTNSYANARNEGLSSQFAYQRNLDDCYAVGTDPSPTPEDTK